MTRARVALSEAAVADILEQAEWYTEQSGPNLAKRWDGAITSTVLHIVKNPRAGSPCNFTAEELGDVRRVSVSGFPRHLLFYQIRKTEIFVLRVLHGARDLESLF